MRIIALLLALVASLQPAMSATTLKTIPPDFDPTQSEVCVVIGRLEFRKEGKPPKPHGKVGVMGTPTITLKHDGTGQSYHITPTGPQWVFYVALPAGKYDITRWVGGALTIHPEAVFEVPPCKAESVAGQQGEACATVYIGMLQFLQSKSFGAHLKAGPDKLPGRLEVVDEYEEAMRVFNESYPEMNCASRKSLLRLYTP